MRTSRLLVFVAPAEAVVIAGLLKCHLSRVVCLGLRQSHRRSDPLLGRCPHRG